MATKAIWPELNESPKFFLKMLKEVQPLFVLVTFSIAIATFIHPYSPEASSYAFMAATSFIISLFAMLWVYLFKTWNPDDDFTFSIGVAYFSAIVGFGLISVVVFILSEAMIVINRLFSILIIFIDIAGYSLFLHFFYRTYKHIREALIAIQKAPIPNIVQKRRLHFLLLGIVTGMFWLDIGLSFALADQIYDLQTGNNSPFSLVMFWFTITGALILMVSVKSYIKWSSKPKKKVKSTIQTPIV